MAQYKYGEFVEQAGGDVIRRRVWHEAPTDSVSRFKNMEAACASIAERWPNVAPPPNAVL
jgi:hypothetical protein